MISIDKQIDCVREEVQRREKLYPKLIEEGRMEDSKAFIEIETMKHVMQTLTQLRGMVSR